MAETAPIKRGGKYCVAGTRDNVSCTNTSYSPGISMHIFPSDKELCQKWTSFVRKHRPNFKPSKYSALCSAHFEPTCFTQVASIESSNTPIQEKTGSRMETRPKGPWRLLEVKTNAYSKKCLGSHSIP